jgi:hypothetical protein
MLHSAPSAEHFRQGVDVTNANGFQPDLARAEWFKSTRSSPSCDNCVEVAFVDQAVAVRDSKDPTGPVLAFTPEEWGAFLGGAKDGEFDLD